MSEGGIYRRDTTSEDSNSGISTSVKIQGFSEPLQHYTKLHTVNCSDQSIYMERRYDRVKVSSTKYIIY